MKKRLAILLSLAMVLTFALAACGGSGDDLSDSKYVGSWKASAVTLGEESGELEGDYILTLNGDGTGTFASEDDVSEFTWQLTSDGFKTKGDIKLKCKDDGDGIYTDFLGVSLHFERVTEGEDQDEDEDVVDFVDGAAYGYAGDDPVEAACYEYMAETVGKSYGSGEISIPTVSIFHEDLTPEDEVLVYGDFWVENYDVNGDTLECVSGGNHPGVMHVSKADYTVTAFDEVADGGDFESSAKELFGDHYDDFMKVYGDSDARNELRKITVSDYVNLNSLDINYYHDEGWDPVELY